MFLRTSADLYFQELFKIWVCYYDMTILLFPNKVKTSSLSIHRTNPRHDALDLTQSKNQNIVLFVKGFENRGFLDN